MNYNERTSGNEEKKIQILFLCNFDYVFIRVVRWLFSHSFHSLAAAALSGVLHALNSIQPESWNKKVQPFNSQQLHETFFVHFFLPCSAVCSPHFQYVSSLSFPHSLFRHKPKGHERGAAKERKQHPQSKKYEKKSWNINNERKKSFLFVLRERISLLSTEHGILLLVKFFVFKQQHQASEREKKVKRWKILLRHFKFIDSDGWGEELWVEKCGCFSPLVAAFCLMNYLLIFVLLLRLLSRAHLGYRWTWLWLLSVSKPISNDLWLI